MNHLELARLCSGLLQLSLVCCLFRHAQSSKHSILGRVLVGGWAAAIVLHTVLSVSLSAADYPHADLISAALCVTLAFGLIFSELVLRRTLRNSLLQHKARHNREAKLRAELATSKASAEDWPKLYEELQQIAAKLRAELGENKAAMAVMNTAHEQLTGSNESLLKTNSDLLLANRRLQEIVAKYQGEASELKRLHSETRAAHALELSMASERAATRARTEVFSELSQLVLLLNGSMESMHRQFPALHRDHAAPNLPLAGASGSTRNRSRSRRPQRPLPKRTRRMPDELRLFSTSVKRIKDSLERLNSFVNECTGNGTIALGVTADSPSGFMRKYACQSTSTETGTTPPQTTEGSPTIAGDADIGATRTSSAPGVGESGV